MGSDYRAPFRRYCEVAKAAGWTVEQTGLGHWKLIPPDRAMPIVIIPSRAWNPRTASNARAKLRKAGLDV